MHDDVTLPGLERILQDILKGLESCVVPDDWSLPVPGPVPVPDVLHHIISTTSSEIIAASTVSGPHPNNADDTVLSHITSSVQPSDRRSSRFEAQVTLKPKKAEIGTETEESPLMRRLAEDFMYVPTKIPDYR